jgi:aerobic-type carbon monoxide dehydrogenase small subunit (CoxS/CutS family)
MNEKDEKDDSSWTVSRRSFLKTMGGGIILSATISPSDIVKSMSAAQRDQAIGPEHVQIELIVNGKKQALEVETRTTLAEALRDKLDFTGTKLVCDRGSCGGCTVLMNGDPICSCMMLACDASGQQIATIEGLARGDQLHPLQECFIEADALQCGFCTPGMIMSCKALLDRNPNPSLADARAAVAGNLCRCGTYPHVFEATLAAAERMKKG